MKDVMLAEPSLISLLGMGLLALTFVAVAALVCILVIRTKRLGGSLFDFLSGRMFERKNPAPPVAPATQIVPRKCPQCGAGLKPDVSEGLCPACLLQRGIATEGGVPPGTPAFVPPTIPNLARLFPQLEILELIGKGGMGAVYKARQPALDRFVALKILAPRSGADLDFAGRFTREARALAKLSHPNIVGVYDFGQADRLSYFIMEYVDGPNLRQIEQAGKLLPREALEIIPQICAALQFAHDEGIVHRDIKPENVLLDKKGRVKIADFGLAKILGQEPKDFRLTGARDVVGTPHYMAPEQVEKPQEVDHRADIYSLGVVFYEMLTGELPLGKFQPPSSCAHGMQIDVRLDEVVLRSLEKKPERRYQQVSEVKTLVETIANSLASPALNAGAILNPSPGRDYRTKQSLFGLPLAHVAWGVDPVTRRPRVAKGWIAIGSRAKGLAAVGLEAYGLIAVGLIAGGIFPTGLLAFGVLSVGLVAYGIISTGLLAIALVQAVGLVSLGYHSVGLVHYGIDVSVFLLLGLPIAMIGLLRMLGTIIQGTRPSAGQSAPARDRFWRFVIVVFVVIPTLGLLGNLALQNFIPTRTPAASTATAAPATSAPPKTGASEPVPGWFPAGSNPSDYEMAIDRNATHGGKASAYVKSVVPHPDGFGTLLQSFSADAYRGRRIRLSGFLRSEDVRNWAGLWLRVDGTNGQVLAFDNMQNRALRGTMGWSRQEIVLDVPEASQMVFMGLLLTGPGQVWMDDLKLEVVGTEIPVTGGKPVDLIPRTPQLEFTNQP